MDGPIVIRESKRTFKIYVQPMVGALLHITKETPSGQLLESFNIALSRHDCEVLAKALMEGAK
jgi:hypothetical protein